MSKKILFIDDEDLVAKTLYKLLSKGGYTVVVCSSGAEAIAKASSEKFDLIISDIRMPEMNGIETIKKIRESYLANKKPLIPEILMSGFADPQLIGQAEKLGVANFFYKPFDLAQFMEAVKKVLAV